MSADSGLAVYKDVADVTAYRERNVTYHDLCNPSVLDEDPSLFYGFWGGCMNEYRRTSPHDGYATIAKWRDELFARRGHVAAELAQLLLRDKLVDKSSQPVAGPFFSLTSNVDAHWLRSGQFSSAEVYEVHGNTENWHCADPRCSSVLRHEPSAAAGTVPLVDGSWAAPRDFAFAVDAETTRLAPEGAPARAPALGPDGGKLAEAFATNWPRCVACDGKARPAVLMFSDSSWCPNEAAKGRWEQWRSAVLKLCTPASGPTAVPPLRVAVLEIGCGANVTTIRQKTEALVEEVNARGATATLLRINPEYALADSDGVRPFTLPLLSTGLAAVTKIDAALTRLLAERKAAHGQCQQPLAAHTAGPMAGLAFEHIRIGAEPPPRPTTETPETEAEAEAAEAEASEAAGCASGIGDTAAALGDGTSARLRSALEGRALSVHTALQRVAEVRREADVQMAAAERAQAKIGQALADIRETQRKLAHFDSLGELLMDGVAKLMSNEMNTAKRAHMRNIDEGTGDENAATN